MKVIKITQYILDVIKQKSSFFEMKLPEVGELWKVIEIKTYPNVNNGNPVVELEHEDGRFMRLSLSDVEVIDVFPTWKKIDYDDAPYFHIGGFQMKYLIKDGYAIKLEEIEKLLPRE